MVLKGLEVHPTSIFLNTLLAAEAFKGIGCLDVVFTVRPDLSKVSLMRVIMSWHFSCWQGIFQSTVFWINGGKNILWLLLYRGAHNSCFAIINGEPQLGIGTFLFQYWTSFVFLRRREEESFRNKYFIQPSFELWIWPMPCNRNVIFGRAGLFYPHNFLVPKKTSIFTDPNWQPFVNKD